MIIMRESLRLARRYVKNNDARIVRVAIVGPCEVVIVADKPVKPTPIPITIGFGRAEQ